MCFKIQPEALGEARYHSQKVNSTICPNLVLAANRINVISCNLKHLQVQTGGSQKQGFKWNLGNQFCADEAAHAL